MITIQKKPYLVTTTEHYEGKYTDNKEFKFFLHFYITYNTGEVMWIGGTIPKNHKEVELDIIKQFKAR